MGYVLVLVRDLMFRSRIGEAAGALGVDARFVREAEEAAQAVRSERPEAIFVDLHSLDRSALAALCEGESRVIGFYSHVDREVGEAARAAGCALVVTRGEFVRRLPELLRPAARFYRPAVSWFRLSGRDRVKWLQGMLTNDIRGLEPGRACLAAACNRQGKMVGVLTVRAFEDHFLLETDPACRDPLREHFDKHIIMEDVRLEAADSEWSLLQIYGGTLQEIGPLPWFASAPWKEGRAWGDHALADDGIALLVPVPAEETARRRLVNAGMREACSAEWESLRISQGFPRWGVDMGPNDLPVEAGLEAPAVSYEKGCYLGQEVLLRLRNFGVPPKRLVFLRLSEGMPPPVGTPVHSEGTAVGAVTSSTAGPVALASVRKGHNEPGARVEVAGRPAEVAPLPWQDRLRRESRPRLDGPT